MLTLKFIMFAIVIASGAFGRDTGRGHIRHKQSVEEYKYNHPPAPENYEAIPVAVVYEDQGIREHKSIKNGMTSGNTVEEVSKETSKSETTITKQPTATEEANDELIDTTTIKQEEPKPTTYRPQKEHQIPVAVVYEPETINYQKASRNNNRGINNRRKAQQPALEEKQTTDEDNNSSSAQVNGHTGTDASAFKRSELNNRRRIPKPAPEKQTIVEDNSSQVAHTIPTSDKPEELYIKQRTQKPATKEIQTTVQSHTPSIPTGEEPVSLVDTQKSKRPVPEQKQTTFRSSQVGQAIPTSDKPEELYIKQKTPKPATKEIQTTVQSHTPSIPTGKEPVSLVDTQKSKRPVPEQKQTTFRSSQVGQAIPTSDKPEELYIKQRTQKPATKENQTTVQSHTPSILTGKQPEKIVDTHKSRRPVPEQKQTTLEDNTGITDLEHQNPPSVPKPERSETIKTTDNSVEYTKRANTGNSTRVREVIPIVQSENVVFSQSGNFKYSYEGGDGTKAFEKGELKTFDDETAGEAVSGGFSYTAKDGNEYSLSYTADENGYRPVGAHLPTPPPIPPAIARALAYLATKTTPEPVTESIEKNDQ